MKKKVRVWTWRSFINNTTPPVLLIYTFAILIGVGSFLLRLPACWKPGMQVSLLDAFFTATSAACVTGLTTISVFDHFNFLGQFVILIIFQLGGLGVMTFAAVSLKILGGRLSLRSQAALEESIYQRDAAKEFQRTFHHIFYLVFCIELTGAVLLSANLIGKMPFLDALWYGFFHSVSAFCNAGFSLWNASLEGQGTFFLVVVMLLVVSGGLGNTVLVELALCVKTRLLQGKRDMLPWFSYHTRMVLVLTGLLLFGGSLMIYLLDYHIRPTSMLDCLVESVVARTAGFQTFSQISLPLPSVLFVLWLMFVGGGPGSCAGGIKVTSLGIWCSHMIAGLLHREEATLFGRRIPGDIMQKVRKLISLTVAWIMCGVFLLSLTEPNVPLKTLVFEQVSAFATVGLSMDFTPQLSTAGKLWICLSMFIGRLGPLTIALSVIGQRTSGISHPEGRIMIG